ncbi:uncharacterized protein DEA37_0009539 [Paragonimus westermani]|uniref:Synergin gamma C-terminal domain-containing protein n=1 Tax=Paragonimus westermani TaxID=34504 RepID=A0A5J4NK17_9TREM|nr:uncharacterized protein DEA37_0009539 [Paragonimus westermani]
MVWADRCLNSRMKEHLPKWVQDVTAQSTSFVPGPRKLPASSIAGHMLITGHRVNSEPLFRTIMRHANPRSLRFTEAVASELSGLRELFRSHMPYITLTDIRCVLTLQIPLYSIGYHGFKTSWESASSEPVIHVRPISLASSIRSMEATAPRCGLCLVTLPTEQPPAMATTTGKIVALAGRSYHMSCANFWINRVQLGLPALALP